MVGDPERSAFIGRVDERQQICRLFETVGAGESRTVIIGGEAGVGKSRLARQIVDDVTSVSNTILSASCLDYGESPLPFGAVVEALRPLESMLDIETQQQLFEPVRKQLAGLLPYLESAASTQNLSFASDGTIGTSGPIAPIGPASRAQLFEAILLLLEGMADRGSVVLIIEDLHWADNSTRDLFAFLVANLNRARVMLMATYRSDELEEGHEFLRYVAQLQRNRRVLRLHLPRFTYDELALFLDDFGKKALDHDLLQEIWQRSQGNPFYAEELLESSREHLLGLPASLHDMLQSRLKDLLPSTQKVLQIASAGSASVEYDALAFAALAFGTGAGVAVTSAAGLADVDWFNEGLRDAVERRMLVADSESDRYSFRHALLREVAYSELLPGERREIHRKYAQWLENETEISIGSTTSNVKASNINGRAAELAQHHFCGGNYPAALTASIVAADVAERSRGYAESHIHIERALQLWPRIAPEERSSNIELADLFERGAMVSHLEGNNSRAAELVQKAIDCFDENENEKVPDKNNRERRLKSLIRLGCYLESQGESQQALAVHENAVHQANNKLSPALRAEIFCAYAQSLSASARHRESLKYAERALEIAMSCGDRAQEANALNILGSSRVVLGKPDEGVNNLRRALEIAEELDTPIEIASGYSQLAITLSGPLNRLNEALDVAVRGVRRVKELSLERHWGVTLRSIVADTLFRMGRWDEVDEVITEALRRSPSGAAVLDLLLARAKLTIGRGQFDDARSDLNSVRALSARAIELRYNVPLETLTAGLALWEGRIDDARTAVSSGLDRVRSTDDVWFVGPLVWHGMRAEAERAEMARAKFDQAEVAAAIGHGEELREMSRESCRSGKKLGALSLVIDAYDGMCEGELCRIKGDPAVEVWASVAQAWDALGQPYPSTYARCHWAEALLSRPKGVKAAAKVLQDAHLSAVVMGAEPMIKQIENVARRAGIDLSVSETEIDIREVAEPSALEHLASGAGLTKRETQVLELLANGESNRAIAEACFISEKTASVHVSKIMSKLGARSRAQVTALVHRASL